MSEIALMFDSSPNFIFDLVSHTAYAASQLFGFTFHTYDYQDWLGQNSGKESDSRLALTEHQHRKMVLKEKLQISL